MLVDMKKRIAAAVLWFYAGWVTGALVAFAAGLSPALAPILGAAGAMIVAGDPRGIIWLRPDRTLIGAVRPTGQVQNPA